LIASTTMFIKFGVVAGEHS